MDVIMNVLLLAPDSKLPNLAIMKISAWHKERGDTVGFNVENFDIAYRSICFSKTNKQSLIKTIDGGPGIDPTIKLPPEIENTPPDQTLYDSPYSVARVTSGCPRHCYFCIVHKMEPRGIRYIMSPDKQWKAGTILRLLDDNILALPSAFDEIFNWQQITKATVRFEYLDMRLMSTEYATKLRQIKHERNTIFFSFDMLKDSDEIERGIKLLLSAGFHGRNMRPLIYMNDENAISDAKKRWDIMRKYKTEPFLMVNVERTERMKKIARRGCRPAIWRHLTTDEIFE